MGASISATLFGLAALFIAFVLTPPFLNPSLRARAFLIWALALACIMFIRDPLIALGLTGAFVAFLSPGAEHRAPLFLLIAGCVPVTLTALLPFPGLNYLTIITHYKIAVLILLVPLLAMSYASRTTRSPTLQRSTAIPDTTIVGYVMFAVIMAYITHIQTGVTAVTSAMRVMLDLLLIVVVPYFAISKFVRNERDLELCLKAFLTTAIILATVAFVSTVKGWDFYRYVEGVSIFNIRDYRYGFERIHATANTHTLGYICGFGMVLLIHLRRSANISTTRMAILMLFLAAGVFVTISRGAMLATAIAMLSYYVFTRKTARQRVALLFVLIGLAAGAALFILRGDTEAVDPFGAVEYRRLLLETSLQYITEHLWVGNQQFYLDPRFQPLVQGMGIIDITNYYLQVLLNYGLIGFVLLFTAVGVLLGRHAKRLLSSATRMDGDQGLGNRQRAVLVAGILGWLALMTTTSDVGLTMFIFVTLLALARASWSFAPAGVTARQRRTAPHRLPASSAWRRIPATSRAVNPVG